MKRKAELLAIFYCSNENDGSLIGRNFIPCGCLPYIVLQYMNDTAQSRELRKLAHRRHYEIINLYSMIHHYQSRFQKAELAQGSASRSS
eukprot:scaffold1697_cov120-Cylindrotheca_fusiformis.AAC.49